MFFIVTTPTVKRDMDCQGHIHRPIPVFLIPTKYQYFLEVLNFVSGEGSVTLNVPKISQCSNHIDQIETVYPINVPCVLSCKL